jgi:DNA-binding IclR family transcriptional regulator
MIYLETIRSETALTLGLASGSRLSMLTSSMGRAYLAVQPPDARAALMAELEKAAGAEGPAQVAATLHEIEIFAKEGCCYSFRDWHDDVNAVAVPFREAREGRWLVLSCSGPASSMGPDVFRERVAPLLKSLARRLGETVSGAAA